MSLDLTLIREQFPALQRPAIFLDNPAGTQVAQACLERMTAYLVHTNANHEGAFETSRLSDALVAEDASSDGRLHPCPPGRGDRLRR